MEQKVKQEFSNREKERKLDLHNKWTRREEADFFRIVSTYGVDFDRKRTCFDWSKFKILAKLEKKSDDDILEYYNCFTTMCRKQCGLKWDEEFYDSSIEHISEEKAKRTLDRLELLSKIREEILFHPKLQERLKLCQTSLDVPDWWIPGKHDSDLLRGIAK